MNIKKIIYASSSSVYSDEKNKIYKIINGMMPKSILWKIKTTK